MCMICFHFGEDHNKHTKYSQGMKSGDFNKSRHKNGKYLLDTATKGQPLFIPP